jgi:hypothetical protein
MKPISWPHQSLALKLAVSKATKMCALQSSYQSAFSTFGSHQFARTALEAALL